MIYREVALADRSPAAILDKHTMLCSRQLGLYKVLKSRSAIFRPGGYRAVPRPDHHQAFPNQTISCQSIFIRHGGYRAVPQPDHHQAFPHTIINRLVRQFPQYDLVAIEKVTQPDRHQACLKSMIPLAKTPQHKLFVRSMPKAH